MSKPKRHESDADFWRREVDEVIDTLDMPGMRQCGPVIMIDCTKADLPFAFEINGELHYRGRILKPCAKPKQRKQREIQMDIEGRSK